MSVRVLIGAMVVIVVGLFAFVGCTGGTELCLRCGATRETDALGPLVSHGTTHRRASTAWYERVRGECTSHEWIKAGCWNTTSLRTSRFDCMSCEQHRINDRLAAFADVDAARELSLRFDALPFETRRRALVLADPTCELPVEAALAQLGYPELLEIIRPTRAH